MDQGSCEGYPILVSVPLRAPNRRAQERERSAARAAEAAQRAEADSRLARLICAPSIVILAHRSQASSRHYRAGGAHRTHRSRSSKCQQPSEHEGPMGLC
jgi:hypothetical protein